MEDDDCLELIIWLVLGDFVGAVLGLRCGFPSIQNVDACSLDCTEHRQVSDCCRAPVWRGWPCENVFCTAPAGDMLSINPINPHYSLHVINEHLT